MANVTQAKTAIIVAIATVFFMYPTIVKSLEIESPLMHDTKVRTVLIDDGSRKFVVPPPVVVEAPEVIRKAFVTGYNTVAEQTDSTPCIARDGSNICGRRDVAACPRDIPLGSWVKIAGKKYECVDWTAKKFNGRFDISCDKDMSCPHQITGWYNVKVLQ